jgi:hypothetical protein
MAPAFLLMPTSMDGLFERLLGHAAIGIVGTLRAVMIARNRQALRSK